MLPGCHDIHDRVKDMDLEGVWAQLCFPNMGGFAGSAFAKSKDWDLANECIKAYNDFILDEWCAAYPDRQIPLMMVPYWNIEQTVAEIKRTAAKGAKSDHLPRAARPPRPAVLAHPALGPGAGRRVARPACRCRCTSAPAARRRPSPEAMTANFTVAISLFGLNSMSATAELLLSPVFHKFPDLKIALSEGGIGWMPYMLERIDYVWERHRWYNDVNKDVRPSELFKGHLYGCFISDVAGVFSRHLIGVDQLMFESDYPHSDSQWPHTRKVLEEVMADVPDDEARKMVETNARTLYNFPRAAA